MTTFHFAGVAVWSGLGTFLRTGGHMSTVSITDPSTGLTPAGLTQGGVGVTKITAAFPTGYFAFTTTDVPGVLIDWGNGPILIEAIELPALILSAAAPTDAAVAALVTGASSTRTAMDGRYVGKGSLVYYAADYASLSAAITAVPAGGVLRLAAATYAANGLTSVNKNITIEGMGSRVSIIDAGANAYGFNLPSSGSAHITFRDVGFTGSTSAQVFLGGANQHSAKFVDCRFSGFSQYAIQTAGCKVRAIRCEFDGLGTGTGTALYNYYGPDTIQLKDCSFRYLFRGLYGSETNGPAKNVVVSGCLFDGGWMYIKNSGGTGSGGTVTYTSTTVTDTGASFAALTANSTVRAMAVKRSANATGMTGPQLTDSAANFVSAGVKAGDIVRTSTLWGVVDKVLSATVLHVEEWLTQSDYQPTTAPSTTVAYTVYGFVIGRVASNTSTVITVDAWRDWDGTIATPASGTLYEVAPKSDYQLFTIGADKVHVHDNIIRRAWSDSVSIQRCSTVSVTNNVIYDGQDVGITVEDAAGTNNLHNVLISGNRITHQGTAGIYMGHTKQSACLGNVIEDPQWMSLPATTFAGIQIQDCLNLAVKNNFIARYNSPNALRAVNIRGTSDDIELDNRSYGYTTDLQIDGTGVTNVWGRFQPNHVLSLVNSAVGPRGQFSGTGVPAIPASVGSTFLRTDGGASTSLYVKETSSASTTWAAK